MAKKRDAEVPEGAKPLAVVEVVDECRAALAAEFAAYGERNNAEAPGPFRSAEFDYWIANNVKKLTDALRADVLG